MPTNTRSFRFSRILPIVLSLVLFTAVTGVHADDGTHGTTGGFVPPPPGSGGGRTVQTLPMAPTNSDPDTSIEAWDRLEILVRVWLFLRFV